MNDPIRVGRHGLTDVARCVMQDGEREPDPAGDIIAQADEENDEARAYERIIEAADECGKARKRMG
ncbi:MAG: hypothetical protein ACE5E5_15725 [Phycisphaerae bacterium]